MWFWLVLVCAECFCEGGDDKRIPLLRDVFDAFPNTPVNIDIKVNNDTLIKKVCVCVSISVSVILCVGSSSGIKHNISSFFLVANFYQIFCTSSKAALVLTIVNLKLCIWSVRQALKWGSIINILPQYPEKLRRFDSIKMQFLLINLKDCLLLSSCYLLVSSIMTLTNIWFMPHIWAPSLLCSSCNNDYLIPSGVWAGC